MTTHQPQVEKSATVSFALGNSAKRHHEFALAEEDSDDSEGDGTCCGQPPLKQTAVALEDSASKAARLERDGIVLASDGKYNQALRLWNEAVDLAPERAELYEMKAQLLMLLEEYFPAVQAAEQAVKKKPEWVEGWLTLGRCQMNYGEVHVALETFSLCWKLAQRQGNKHVARELEDDVAHANTLVSLGRFRKLPDQQPGPASATCCARKHASSPKANPTPCD
eukprot:m.262032 g.262032  ORF g.262032 m.262032 type:complete len:223 (-) comp15586_c0_seq2:3633-4301(-)